jgi:hypothetical protein
MGWTRVVAGDGAITVGRIYVFVFHQRRVDTGDTNLVLHIVLGIEGGRRFGRRGDEGSHIDPRL